MANIFTLKAAKIRAYNGVVFSRRIAPNPDMFYSGLESDFSPAGFLQLIQSISRQSLKKCHLGLGELAQRRPNESQTHYVMECPKEGEPYVQGTLTFKKWKLAQSRDTQQLLAFFSFPYQEPVEIQELRDDFVRHCNSLVADPKIKTAYRRQQNAQLQSRTYSDTELKTPKAVSILKKSPSSFSIHSNKARDEEIAVIVAEYFENIGVEVKQSERGFELHSNLDPLYQFFAKKESSMGHYSYHFGTVCFDQHQIQKGSLVSLDEYVYTLQVEFPHSAHKFLRSAQSPFNFDKHTLGYRIGKLRIAETQRTLRDNLSRCLEERLC